MTQVYILLANRLRQALSALTLLQQQLGRTDAIMGNAIQRPKEQTSFDRKEDKAGSTCLNERGSHPTNVLGWCSTSPSHGATIFPVYISTTCVRMIGIMRRLDGTIRSPAMKGIYIAVIRPRMEYAGAVLSGGPTGCLDRTPTRLFCKKALIVIPSS